MSAPPGAAERVTLYPGHLADAARFSHSWLWSAGLLTTSEGIERERAALFDALATLRRGDAP